MDDISNQLTVITTNKKHIINPFSIYKTSKSLKRCSTLCYTSKCSYLDNEPVKKHDTYKGKRVKRGLFKTSKRCLINADTNGSANILVKFLTSNSQHLPKVVAKRYGCVNHPPRLKLNDLVA